MFLLLFWGTAFLLLYSTSDSCAEMAPPRPAARPLPDVEIGIQSVKLIIKDILYKTS